MAASKRSGDMNVNIKSIEKLGPIRLERKQYDDLRRAIL